MNKKEFKYRCFVFTRTNPYTSDYEHLETMAANINAALAFKTIRLLNKTKLLGFITLRGPRAKPSEIMYHFPKNFLVNRLHPIFYDGYDWLESTTNDCKSVHIDGTLFFNGKDHPFKSVKRLLTYKEHDHDQD